jgi:hypothetical protein
LNVPFASETPSSKEGREKRNRLVRAGREAREEDMNAKKQIKETEENFMIKCKGTKAKKILRDHKESMRF